MNSHVKPYAQIILLVTALAIPGYVGAQSMSQMPQTPAPSAQPSAAPQSQQLQDEISQLKAQIAQLQAQLDQQKQQQTARSKNSAADTGASMPMEGEMGAMSSGASKGASGMGKEQPEMPMPPSNMTDKPQGGAMGGAGTSNPDGRIWRNGNGEHDGYACVSDG